MSLTTVDKMWADQLPLTQLYRHKGARRLFPKISNIADAFKPQQTLCCIDGGIKEGLHLAGSGVLMDRQALQRLVEEMGVTEFTTHDNCGAYALAFPDDPKKNENVVFWGRDMAARFGIEHRHIAADEMDRPEHLHNETVVYYDGSRMFNRIEGMPVGFTVTRFDRATAQAALKLSIQIAFGKSGFGGRFGFVTPLQIVAIAHPKDPDASLKVLEAEIKEITKQFPVGKTSITGFKTAWVLRDI